MPNCGDGFVFGTETCDDGGAGGCNSTCTGSNSGFTCSGGSQTTKTVCSKNETTDSSSDRISSTAAI